MINGVYSVLLLLFTAGNAYAYVDPNTGSILLQILIGGVAGVFVLLRLFKKRMADFFRRFFR